MKKIILAVLIFSSVDTLSWAKEQQATSVQLLGKKKKYKPKKKRGFLGLFGKRNQCDCPKH